MLGPAQADCRDAVGATRRGNASGTAEPRPHRAYRRTQGTKTASGLAWSPLSVTSAIRSPPGPKTATGPGARPVAGSGAPWATRSASSGCHVLARELGRGGVGKRKHGEGRGELVERARARDVVAARPGAAQRGEVAADAERGAEVTCERADVGAARAGDGHVGVDHPGWAAAPYRGDVERASPLLRAAAAGPRGPRGPSGTRARPPP